MFISGDIEDPKFHSSIVCATNLMLMEPKTHAVDCSRSTLGRFVYVRLLHKTPLTLCEVQVFPGEWSFKACMGMVSSNVKICIQVV